MATEQPTPEEQAASTNKAVEDRKDAAESAPDTAKVTARDMAKNPEAAEAQRKAGDPKAISRDKADRSYVQKQSREDVSLMGESARDISKGGSEALAGAKDAAGGAASSAKAMYNLTPLGMLTGALGLTENKGVFSNLRDMASGGIDMVKGLGGMLKGFGKMFMGQPHVKAMSKALSGTMKEASAQLKEGNLLGAAFSMTPLGALYNSFKGGDRDKAKEAKKDGAKAQADGSKEAEAKAGTARAKSREGAVQGDKPSKSEPEEQDERSGDKAEDEQDSLEGVGRSAVGMLTSMAKLSPAYQLSKLLFGTKEKTARDISKQRRTKLDLVDKEGPDEKVTSTKAGKKVLDDQAREQGNTEPVTRDKSLEADAGRTPPREKAKAAANNEKAAELRQFADTKKKEGTERVSASLSGLLEGARSAMTKTLNSGALGPMGMLAGKLLGGDKESGTSPGQAPPSALKEDHGKLTGTADLVIDGVPVGEMKLNLRRT